MPVLEVELVTAAGEEPPWDLAGRLADAAGQVFGTPPGRTWVRLRTLARDAYAENGGGPPEGTLPVFVSVLRAQVPAPGAITEEVRRLTEAVASACDRPAEHVHVLYQPQGAGRLAFGGRLVEES